VSQVQLTKDQKRAEIKATFAGNLCDDSSSSSSSDGDESDEEYFILLSLSVLEKELISMV
jgi:hypothetical protein